jgi:hypothetical protein
MLPSVFTGVSVKDILAQRVEVLGVFVLGVLAVEAVVLKVGLLNGSCGEGVDLDTDEVGSDGECLEGNVGEYVAGVIQ